MNSRSLIGSAQQKIEKNKHFWKDERVVKNNLNFSFGYNFIRQNEVNNTLLEFKQKSGEITEMVNMKYVPDKFVSNYSVTIDYRILNSLFLGLGLNYSEFTYSAKNMLELVFFDFKLQNYSSHLFLKYQSRNHVGLRPYASLGLGYLVSYRKKSDGIILDFTDDPDILPTILYYDVPNKIYEFPQVLYEAGLDYLPAPKLHIILGSKISIYQNINFNSLIDQFNFALGAYISYWF